MGSHERGLAFVQLPVGENCGWAIPCNAQGHLPQDPIFLAQVSRYLNDMKEVAWLWKQFFLLVDLQTRVAKALVLIDQSLSTN
jgi:hypothetical protein